MKTAITPLEFINTLRNSDKYIEMIYMQGGCYQFHLILKSLFPDAEVYITPSKGHVVTKIGGVYYDIRGIYKESIVFNIKDEELKEIKKWSFSQAMMLSIGECRFCEEPFLIPTDLSHLNPIKALQSKIEELEADKLEMANAIAKNWIVEGAHEDYCINCKNRGLDKRITHSKDCIVKKSNKYIKEVEKLKRL